jgi:hypothetical protein
LPYASISCEIGDRIIRFAGSFISKNNIGRDTESYLALPTGFNLFNSKSWCLSYLYSSIFNEIRP